MINQRIANFLRIYISINEFTNLYEYTNKIKFNSFVRSYRSSSTSICLPVRATFAERPSDERSFFLAMFEERATSDEFCEITKRSEEGGKTRSIDARAGRQI